MNTILNKKSMAFRKVVKNQIFKKSLLFLETHWILLFLSFSLARPKTKAGPPNSQQ